MKNYIHHFACWAAARAIQNPNNNGTKTSIIKEAIENAGFEDYVKDPNMLDNYHVIHQKLVKILNKQLCWDLDKNYGVIAKIIAIYFKVSIILPFNAPKKIIEQIYPPIDSFNLKTLELNKVMKWTSIDKAMYLNAISKLVDYCAKHKINFIEFEEKNRLIRK
jgi:hypothetical protein